MKQKILSMLKSNTNKFISGQKISEELGVSRAAVWKYIKALKQEGYEIESISRRGYRIITSPDLLTQEEIKNYLSTKCIGKKIMHFDTIGSTNIKAKELADLGEQEGTIVIGEEQTLGRGRLGRSWVSPKYKGIWMSIILRPNINPMHVSKITQVGAAAVCKAAEEMGIKTQIKWPNDIILNNKKVCGILTEMSAELNKINYVVMGIGINVNIDENEFPDDIKHMAASFKSEIGKEIVRKELAARLLNNFELLYNEFIHEGTAKTSIDICRENSILLGKEINIIRDNKTISAKAVDLDDEGELIIQHSNGEIQKLISGEVSVRGINGYV